LQVLHDGDFASALVLGPQSVQGQNWDPSMNDGFWDSLCGKLGGSNDGASLEGQKIPGVVVNYGSWVKQLVSSECPESTGVQDHTK